jgi:hypothetical protein
LIKIVAGAVAPAAAPPEGLVWALRRCCSRWASIFACSVSGLMSVKALDSERPRDSLAPPSPDAAAPTTPPPAFVKARGLPARRLSRVSSTYLHQHCTAVYLADTSSFRPFPIVHITPSRARSQGCIRECEGPSNSIAQPTPKITALILNPHVDGVATEKVDCAHSSQSSGNITAYYFCP